MNNLISRVNVPLAMIVPAMPHPVVNGGIVSQRLQMVGNTSQDRFFKQILIIIFMNALL